jgi:hypothetical protein
VDLQTYPGVTLLLDNDKALFKVVGKVKELSIQGIVRFEVRGKGHVVKTSTTNTEDL